MIKGESIMSMKDKLSHTIVYKVEKFQAKNTEEILEKNLKPYDVEVSTPQAIAINCLLDEGIDLLLDLLIGAGGTVYSNATARLGVGDDATAPSASQTSLQAVTNKLWKAMNATYPQVSSGDVIFQSDFVDTEAEFAWLEETVVNAADDTGDNLCRQNTSLGTKPAGQTWRLTATITIT